jgi:predicted PurR-regulated permease PerM
MRWLPLLDPRTARVLFTILVVAGALTFAYAARETLIAFLFAIFFAYLVDPLVSHVQPWVKGSRGRAIAAVYLAFILALGLLGYLLGPRLVDDTKRLAQTLPSMFQKLASGQIAFTIGSQRGWSYETQVKIQHFLAEHQKEMFDWAKGFLAKLAGVGKHAWWLLLVPILGVFFLKDGGSFARSALDLLSRRRQREFLDAVMQDVNVMLAHFIRAQLILALLSGIVYTGGLLLLQVQYGLVLGAIGGALEFIPMVGPLVAFVLIVFIAVVTGYKHVFLILIFLGVWRVVQDYVNSPRIMGGQLELHGLAVLFGVLAGGEVAGVIGVYLSIPIMASLRIVWRHWRVYMESAGVVVPASDAMEIPPG